ncbi:cytochrome P450 4B1-like [Anguilla rostrata]|uniref:cytochrome P450 4B1-like n=1 Tax=Anguilla rostrata TaxID=7938 RepID=UPI0030D24CCB
MELVESLTNGQLSLNLGRVYHLTFVFCLVLVVLKITKLFVERHRLMQVLRSFPGPPVHWFYGHVLELRQDGTDLDVIVRWGESYPLAFPIWFGPFVSFLTIHHPEYVKTLLTSQESKDVIAYTSLIPWLGDGLLVSQGKKWFRHRRLLTPGFHYDVLKPYVKIMADSTKIMLDKWEAYANKDESFELFEHVSLMTLDSIMKCAFSCETNCQIESGTNSYIQAVYELNDLINLRFRTYPYHSETIFNLSPHGYRFRKASRIAHQHTEEVVRKRKEALKNEKELGRIQKKRNLDFLDILLCARDEQQQGLSDEEIRDEVQTFMFAGHDTTASGISWILYCLACNPEHQQRAREEVLQVLEGKDTMDWEDLSKIPYTTMCIKECLRLYPPVPWLSRKLTKPMTFFDGRSIPEGSLVGASVYGIHRNSTVWENPEVFDPLRFLPENCARRSPHAFVPFSAGPRNCIGQKFAMNEMKVATALILRRFQLAKDPERTPKLIPHVVLHSLNGIHLKIKRVELEP